MKEIFVTYTAEITEIVESPEECVEEIVKKLHKDVYPDELSVLLKDHLHVHDVRTKSFKTKVRDKEVEV